MFILSATISSCNENDKIVSDSHKNQTTEIMTTEKVNNYSSDICGFHDYSVTYLWDRLQGSLPLCDSVFLLQVRAIVGDLSLEYSFEFIERGGFLNSWDNSFFVNMCMDAMQTDTLDLSLERSLYERQFDIDCSLIERKANEAVLVLEDLFYNSNTPDEMEIAYKRYVNGLLVNVGNSYEYMCIKFYTDMYLSSFTTWCNILNGDRSKVSLKKKESWLAGAWRKVKTKAKETWKELKPVVSADAEGAVAGAMAGACVGGVGAGPGAASGAVATSTGKAVGMLVDKVIK